MTTKNSNRALLTSVVALLLCCSMLIGATFAWFTDSATSGSNVIASGNLDVEVQYTLDGDNWSDLDGANDLFQIDLWEPGHTEVAVLKIENKGSLALQYSAMMNILHETVGMTKDGEEIVLSDILTVSTLVQQGGIVGEITAALAFTGEDKVAYETIASFKSGNILRNGQQLQPGDSHYLVVKVDMPDTVGNEANHDGTNKPSIEFGINVMATQLPSESDSFGSDYDAEAAQVVGTGKGTLNVGAVAVEVHVRNMAGSKVGSVVVDTDSLADPSKPVEVNYQPSEYKGNFTITDGYESQVVDITVTNLKEDNTTPVKTYIRLPAGLNPATVSVYHYNEKIAGPEDYNPNSGYVTVYTTSFSPFTVVYDAESVYTPPIPLPEGCPTANVVNSTEYENVDLPWGSYGQWSPTAGLDSHLEAAYTFSCEETPDEAANNPYANWYCDFVVVLDKDLGENEIFLGGNYGTFGWVGFHNGKMTLEANTEIPLLGSVTTHPWTYLEVVQNVGTFICGVGDVDDALKGATFTVMLRLTNPENEKEFYNVATIKYIFK